MNNQIEELINNFDFVKVQKIMKFLNWTWFPRNDVPSLDELKKEANSLLKEAMNQSYCDISTGGFEVINDNTSIN